MKKSVCSIRILGLALCLVCCEFIGAVGLPTAFAQEEEQSSRRKTDVVEKIEAAGGRVMQISSADSTREVSFYLAGKKIEDQHLKDLGNVSDVIWLNLANTAVTDDGLKEIAGMKLQKLHLEKTGIGDSGLAHLKDMSDLEYLNLYGTTVTDAGLKHLEKLSKLKRLYVWQSKVTKEGMKSLEEKIPGLKVIGESKLPVSPPPEKKEDANAKAKEAKLKSREQAVAKKEKELKEREAALQKREEAIEQKEKDDDKDED